MQSTIDWLLSAPAWMEYRIRLDLLAEPQDSHKIIESRQAMLKDPAITDLIVGLSSWPGQVLNSHKSASQPFHRLNFLADLGLNMHDPGISAIVSKVMEHHSEQGPFQLPAKISVGHGGSGDEVWAWALCDAPLLLHALIRLGMQEHPQVQKALQFVIGLVRENGWPCAVSPELGNFRGPGRKADPCPFANLAMLKVLGQIAELRESAFAFIGIESLLNVWDQRQNNHPYMFYMGIDFCKLKAPLIWYDILHVLDVLSLFPSCHADPRFKSMIHILEAKQDANGLFTAESIWTVWKDWEFAQKKTPSRWITFLAHRILSRVEMSLPNPPSSLEVF